MNLVDTIKELYVNKQYEVRECNYEFIVKDTIYSIDMDYLNELYKVNK